MKTVRGFTLKAFVQNAKAKSNSVAHVKTMKRPNFIPVLIFLCAATALAEGTPPVLLVNPLMGTDSTGGF